MPTWRQRTPGVELGRATLKPQPDLSVFVTQGVDCAIAVGKYHPLKGQFTTRDLVEIKSKSYPQITQITQI